MSRDLTKATPLLQEFFPKLKNAYEEMHPGHEMFITHVDRTPVEQLLLFVQGRLPQFPGPIVTWKDGFVMKSEHNDIPSNAFDVAIRINGIVVWDTDVVLRLGAFIPALGYQGKIRWLGTKGDYYHFEGIQ